MKSSASKFNFLAVAGAAMVIFGSFAPAADVAIYGSVSYWEAAGPEALIMILGAIGAVICLAQRKIWLARLAAGIMWIALAWPYLKGLMEPKPESFLAETFDAVADTTTGWATNLAINFVDIAWGTIVLALGCLCVSIGAAWKRKTF
jgi:hypothetical protein